MRLFPVWDISHGDDYTSPLDALLQSRGLSLDDLQVGPECLHPPSALTDLEAGVERLVKAVRQGEKILIYGDYDVDGVTSTAVMLDFLEAVGASCDYMLPDRHRDGYGIKPPAVRRALERRAEVIVTVDNGISAFEALAVAQQEGIDVVVVDHHHQLGELPVAHSVINPNRLDCSYPFKGLAGVGVTFKVVQALSEVLMEGAARRRYLNGLLDLVALGTVADVMPILGENRVLVQRGLQVMEQTQRPGLRQLKAVARCAEGPLSTTSLGFYLGPRINVAGRLESPDLALKLLRARSDAEAAEMAGRLDSLNVKRQKMQRDGIEEAEALVSQEDLDKDRSIVLLGEGWHLGVVGLIAGKLCEKHCRPAIICTDQGSGGLYVGSARSIPGYNVSEGIAACAEHLVSFGGHAAAAGFSLKGENFEVFRAKLTDHANEHITAEDLKPRLNIDLKLRQEHVCEETIKELEALEPCGEGNRSPLFMVEGLKVVAVRRIGKDSSHLKVNLEAGGRPCAALWWGRGDAAQEIYPGQRLNAAFVLERDTYAGNGAVQLVLKDLDETEA
jgi:single-stranded-DNA-specific exonuclease